MDHALVKIRLGFNIRICRTHHGDGFQDFDFFVGMAARGAVLHHQHPNDAAAAQNRCSHQRGITFLTGFQPVGKQQMRLRFGQGDRHRLRGDEPNQSFANHQPGPVNSLLMESFCREQLEDIAGAADVDRAHFGNKIAGDQPGDLVQMLLRCPGPAIASRRLRNRRREPVQGVSSTVVLLAPAATERGNIRAGCLGVSDHRAIKRRPARRRCVTRAAPIL